MSSWIKCSERMPNEDVKVLVYAPRHQRIECAMYIERYSQDPTSNYRAWDFGEYDLHPSEVTHWMPLPDKPEGEG